jgi:hypothetical protein
MDDPIRVRRRRLFALALPAFVWLTACGDEEVAAPGVVGLTGPVTLSIASVEATGGALVSGDTGGELTLGCDGLLHVRVEVNEWWLRAPSACAGARQCGWIVLRLDPTDGAGAVAVQSAASLITVPVSHLDSVFRAHRVRVELRSTTGERYLVGGEVLSDEVDVTLRAPAGCEVDAGLEADAPDGDAATDGGADAGDAAQDAADEAAPIDAPSESAADAMEASDVVDAADDAADGA